MRRLADVASRLHLMSKLQCCWWVNNYQAAIIKEECDPFDYTIPETGEEISSVLSVCVCANGTATSNCGKTTGTGGSPMLSTFSSNGKLVLAEA
jgi:hypothetical protein